MFLGTSRIWWIMTGLVFVLGLVFVGSDLGGGFGTTAGVLLVILAMILFAAAPRRRRPEALPAPEERVTATAPTAPAEPPRPRPAIEGRDPSEV